MKKQGLAILALCGLVNLPAFAGLEMVDGDGATTYYSTGRVATDAADDPLLYVMDGQRDVINIINRTDKVYAQGNTAEYCNAVQEMQRSAMAAMSPEQRMMLEQYNKKKGAESNAKPAIKVEHKGEGGKIAGYATERYAVYANGKLAEELWISTGRALLSQIDGHEKLQEMANRFTRCVSAAFGGDSAPLPEESAEYRALMKSGWELKKVSYTMGMTETEQVREIRIKEIPESRFSVPAGFRKITLREMHEMQQDME